MVEPAAFMVDQEPLLREGEILDDDIIRGDAPAAAVIPWLSGMLGAQLRILPGNILGEERSLSWEELERLRLDAGHPWYRKYMAFAEALTTHAQGRYPVSHGALFGPCDIMGELRGHTQSILDLVTEPERAQAVLWRCADIFKQITEELWARLPRWQGGYFDGMYQLWAPGSIVRMQEDASAVYSPALYRRFLQPVDRYLASSYANAFIHLHSTSMFLLDAFLEIEELRCLQINNDALGPPLDKMVPCFRRVQDAGRSLVIRGSFAPDEVRLLRGALGPRGMYLLILVEGARQTEPLRAILGM